MSGLVGCDWCCGDTGDHERGCPASPAVTWPTTVGHCDPAGSPGITSQSREARVPVLDARDAFVEFGAIASDDECDVIRRCIERLIVLRKATAAGTAEVGRPWSDLDEALRAELVDVRRAREQADAQHDAVAKTEAT